jgi:glycerol-3-phosphate cytidylyltransferase-like family protein
MKDAEREENNLIHALEGVSGESKSPPRYKERATIATKLQNTLIKRRIAKDYTIAYKVLISYLDSEDGRRVINKFKYVLGEIRKTESMMENRTYRERDIDVAPMNPVLKKDLEKLIAEWKQNAGNGNKIQNRGVKKD